MTTGDYLCYAAAIAGAVLAHESDEALRATLERFVGVPDPEVEAAMELGLGALCAGLDATAQDAASV
jgi:hypothetical protein